MTEAQWLAETETAKLLLCAEQYDPERTLGLVKNTLIRRRIQLAAPRTILDITYQFDQFVKSDCKADGVDAFLAYCSSWHNGLYRDFASQMADYFRAYLSPTISDYIQCGVKDGIPKEQQECNLIREAFYPFPINVDPAWLTSTVVTLLKPLLNDNAFHLMPILADALEDAGCDAEGVLSHCRQTKKHAGFCWVLNLFRHV